MPKEISVKEDEGSSPKRVKWVFFEGEDGEIESPWFHSSFVGKAILEAYVTCCWITDEDYSDSLCPEQFTECGLPHLPTADDLQWLLGDRFGELQSLRPLLTVALGPKEEEEDFFELLLNFLMQPIGERFEKLRPLLTVATAAAKEELFRFIIVEALKAKLQIDGFLDQLALIWEEKGEEQEAGTDSKMMVRDMLAAALVV